MLNKCEIAITTATFGRIRQQTQCSSGSSVKPHKFTQLKRRQTKFTEVGVVAK